jgi:hypothetical protein
VGIEHHVGIYVVKIGTPGIIDIHGRLMGSAPLSNVQSVKRPGLLIDLDERPVAFPNLFDNGLKAGWPVPAKKVWNLHVNIR